MPVENFWTDREVLVTGANGFIGSWLTERLVDYGANVVVLIKDNIPYSKFNLSKLEDRVTVVNGCLEDYSLLESVMKEVDTCFHLGAKTQVETAETEPVPTFESNIRGTWNILEAVRRADVKLVLASSDKAYGPDCKLPQSEDDPLKGRYPYDVSKTCTDLIAQSYFNTYGLCLAITRCGNTYGGGDTNFNRLVPGTVMAVLSGKNPVLRSDGTHLRDFIYVKDVVDAYMSLAENLESVKGNVFNVGTGNPTSVIQVVEKVLNLCDKDLEPVIENRAKHEIKEQYLDCSKIRSMLGWENRYNLDEGLRETIEWYKEFVKYHYRIKENIK